MKSTFIDASIDKINDNSYFYANLPTVNDFKQIAKNDIYEEVPLDWHLLLTDVKGSTQAIKEGKYKEVNMLGALSIISILNLNKNLDLPFVFGGDGAFILIPASLLELAQQAFLHLKELSLATYGLELRVGSIPVRKIHNNDCCLSIAKYAVSKNYSQAIIKGGGLEFADKMLKERETYLIKGKLDEAFSLDVDGLECRWNDIPSPQDETISLLIKCRDEAYYKSVLTNLDIILGKNVNRHPITPKKLKLSYDAKKLGVEGSLHSRSMFVKPFVILKFRLINLLGSILMKLNIAEWGEYKDNIVATTDAEKFDDMLRMVLSLTHQQVQNLEIYLEREYKKKYLVYGLHRAKSALMTCLVFQRHGKQIHFVDSSDGGYSVAATMLKKKMEDF